MILYLLLLLSLGLLFYCAIVGDLPDVISLKERILGVIFSVAGALTFFIVGTVMFQSALSGFIWGVLGWYVPIWISRMITGKKKRRLRMLARDFVASASGLYAVGQMTSDVIRVMAERFPAPFSHEFRDMLGAWDGSPYGYFPLLFKELGKKYSLREFDAVASILSAAEVAGGPISASKGLKRLGNALRQRDRLEVERIKEVMEPRIAAIVTIIILLIGMLLDATVLKQYFIGTGGKIMLAVSSLLMVGLIFLTAKISRSRDLD